MATVENIDVSSCAIDVRRDLSIATRQRQPGPPVRIDGMTLGIVTMTEDAPHGGEVHPDGDEFLYVISGRVRVTWESDPDVDLVLSAGDACIVPKGEWHNVSILEPTQLVHLTPGPNGDHRSLA